MENISKLMDAVYFAFNNQNWRSTTNPYTGVTTTYCNEAVNYICEQMGYKGFKIDNSHNPYDAIMANSMCDIFDGHMDEWELCESDAAQMYANGGRLVIAAWKNQSGEHGHVCIVIPGLLEFSDKLKMKVPKIMNVGSSVFIGKKASWAFSETPKFYALKETDK
jgi:hypothetical protein